MNNSPGSVVPVEAQVDMSPHVTLSFA